MRKFNDLFKALQKRKAIFSILASLVVSVTMYTLILPAFTLEKEQAKEQGGIDVEEQIDANEKVQQEQDPGDPH